jgi:hypothetical protein
MLENYKPPEPEYLANLVLRKGCGTGEAGDRCAIQEVRAWEGLDASIDACPDTDDPLIVALVIRIQDARPEWRKAIVPLLPKIPGSRGSDALSLRRLYRCADWQIRELLPAIMEMWPELKTEAKKLRGLEAIVDRQTAKAVADQLARTRDRALDLDLALDLAVAVARTRVRARDLASDLVLDLARDVAVALARARARGLDLDLDLDLDGKLSPVALIAELLDMQEPAATQTLKKGK